MHVSLFFSYTKPFDCKAWEHILLLHHFFPLKIIQNAYTLFLIIKYVYIIFLNGWYIFYIAYLLKVLKEENIYIYIYIWVCVVEGGGGGMDDI